MVSISNNSILIRNSVRRNNGRGSWKLRLRKIIMSGFTHFAYTALHGGITQHYYCKKKRLAFDNYHRTIKHVALLRISCRCWHFKGSRVLSVKLNAVRAWGSLDPNFVMPTGCNYFRIFHRRVAAWNKVGRHTCWPKWCGGSWRLQDMWNSLSGNAEVQLPSVFLN